MAHFAEPDAIAAAYQGTRTRATSLLRHASEDAATRTVPACPEWTVGQLAAHMCGVCDDVFVAEDTDLPNGFVNPGPFL